MKTIITICIFCCLFVREPTTCDCQYEDKMWTAYCGEKISCEKCCDKTKPKPKKKKKKNE